MLLLSIMATGIIICNNIQLESAKVIVINEVSNSYETKIVKYRNIDDYNYDYVELYNMGSLPYITSALFLSDDINQLRKLEVPETILQPEDFLLIKLDEDSPFKIAKTGEMIYLSDQSGKIIAQVNCPELNKNTSYYRVSDGGSVWRTGVCSPGKSNLNSANILRAPSFSHTSGFYANEFNLSLTADNGINIYYTLDGSIPSEESFLYHEPIHITDASRNENIWSMRTDVSTGFLTVPEYYLPIYQTPDSLIDKCTVVRAACIDENGNVGLVHSATYFVGFSEKNGYDGMNIISIITDPENLFDYDSGIYVSGKKYDEYLASGIPQWYDDYWTWWDANYRQSGREWEREAYLEFFDVDGKLMLAKDAGIRIQGGGSRGLVPKSFNLYARKDYDNDSRFRYCFFDNSYEPQRMTLFTGADDNLIKSRDYLMGSLISNRSFATMRFKPYVLFLDGEYWGCYWLTEKYDGEYFEYYFDVDSDNVVMIKHGLLAVGKDEDMPLYTEMYSYIADTDFTIDENYKRACELIDIDSFIEYYAAEIYIARYVDWPDGNFALWRTRNVDSWKYSDGRWRWILFDVNSGSMTASMAESDTFSSTIALDPLFASLSKNSEFRKQFATTILDMANNEFLPENIDLFYDNFKELMREPLEKEYERYYGTDNQMMQYFDYDTDDIITFFHRRYDYITSYFSSGE